MGLSPVVKNYSYCLIHVPDLVCYGSKPRREIAKEPDVKTKITASLRSYAKAVCYPPNQTFIGNLTPDELAEIPRPWLEIQPDKKQQLAEKIHGQFGEILDQETFYALLKLADVLTPPLFETRDSILTKLRRRLAQHHLFHEFSDKFEDVFSHSQNPQIEKLKQTTVLPLRSGKDTYGYFSGDIRAEGRDDENLAAHDLLENLCTKASGVVALKWLLHREKMNPDQIDFLISCGEEACGDRYQRGGGGMAKAIGEMCGCVNASGMDIKNFCAAPASALITACALVQAGVYDRIVVVGGGSLAKLGMKFQGFLQHKMEILDDCLASMAFLVTRDDKISPIVRLDKGAIGKVPISASTSDEAVFRHYFLKPLESVGLKCTDIDKYALELQNPEIMEFAGSGDVARKNYKKISAMAVMADQLDKNDMQAWITKVGMPGFAPTQGHIPSAFPYLGHAIESMKRKEIRRAMFLSRASLFLNRCTNLLDGVSFILERNPATFASVENGE
jgi:betaine reductase